MGCLKIYADEYIRIKEKMENTNENANQNDAPKKNEFSQEQLKQLKEIIESSQKSSKINTASTVLGIVLGIISILGTVTTVLFNYFTIWSDVKILKGQVETLTAAYTEMHEYIYEDGGVKDQLGDINKILSSEAKVIDANEDIIYTLAQVSNNLNTTNLMTSSFIADKPVGTDEYGNICLAKDLINETILLTYEDDGKEVYFLGQYNNNYHWDGKCIINSYYSDGTLFGISEAIFQDGKRLEFKTFAITEETINNLKDSKKIYKLLGSSKNENMRIWTKSDRVIDKNSNTETYIGTSIDYISDYIQTKDFTQDNVKPTDILYIEDFSLPLETVIYKYYYGHTYNFRYNHISDTNNTEKAYYAEYTKIDDEYHIRLLYVGNFINGEFNDKTGNAWEIVYADDSKQYAYNKGTFNESRFTGDNRKNVDINQIEEIIADYEFDCELNWKIN